MKKVAKILTRIIGLIPVLFIFLGLGWLVLNLFQKPEAELTFSRPAILSARNPTLEIPVDFKSYPTFKSADPAGLEIISYLDQAYSIAQGTSVAKVEVWDSLAQMQEYVLRAGVQTAQWLPKKPDREKVTEPFKTLSSLHKRAESANSWLVYTEYLKSYQAFHYLSQWNFEQPIQVSRIKFDFLIPLEDKNQAVLGLVKIALTGKAKLAFSKTHFQALTAKLAAIVDPYLPPPEKVEPVLPYSPLIAVVLLVAAYQIVVWSLRKRRVPAFANSFAGSLSSEEGKDQVIPTSSEAHPAETISSFTTRNWDIIRFCLLFLLLSLAFMLTFTKLEKAQFMVALTKFTAQCTGFGLRLVGIPAQVNGYLVRTDVSAMTIIPECTGLQLMAIYFACIIAYPTTWSRRAFALLVGWPPLFAVNIGRLVILGVTLGRYPRLFDFIHVYLWEVIFAVFAVFMLLFWIAYKMKAVDKFIFLGKVLVLCVILLPAWLAFSPIYCGYLAQSTLWALNDIFNYGIDKASLMSTRSLVGGKTIAFEYLGRTWTTFAELFTLNVVPFLALMIVTPRLKKLRRILLIMAGLILLFIIHVLSIMAMFHFSVIFSEAVMKFIEKTVASISSVIPFMIWIALVWKYWLADKGKS